MGAITLRTTVGTVNFTDWLHITIQKVPTGSPVEWETWVDVPISSYNFIVPNLDPDNYIMRFYDSPTNSDLGTLVLELIVNAMTSEWAYERRFYKVGGTGAYDPADGATVIVDPALIGRNVTGVFKEGYGYYKPVDQYEFDATTGTISILTGVQLSNGEQMSVEVKYATGSTSAGDSGHGLYSGILDIPETTRTLTASEKNKLCRLVGTTAIQVLTLPPLASIGVDDGFYFDNTVGGTPVCVRLLCTGADKIQFNGFPGFQSLPEIWVGRGEHLNLRRYNTSYWEVRSDYQGVRVGEIVTPGVRNQNSVVTEMGQLMDGDEYPRLWWWLNNVLPASSKYTAANVADSGMSGFFHTPNRRGQFCLHSDPSIKKFRMPHTGGLVMKGLNNMDLYGIFTAERQVDAPGGIQPKMLLKHRHWAVKNKITNGSTLTPIQSLAKQKNDGDDFKYLLNGDGSEPDCGMTSEDFGSNGGTPSYSFGNDMRVDNTGVIFARIY